jgi:hypothetical protein
MLLTGCAKGDGTDNAAKGNGQVDPIKTEDRLQAIRSKGVRGSESVRPKRIY